MPSTTNYTFWCKNKRGKNTYKVIINASKIYMNKVSTYRLCKFNAPINENCGVIPHKYGMFLYWESTETYPDNTDLYDSSTIKIEY